MSGPPNARKQQNYLLQNSGLVPNHVLGKLLHFFRSFFGQDDFPSRLLKAWHTTEQKGYQKQYGLVIKIQFLLSLYITEKLN